MLFLVHFTFHPYISIHARQDRSKNQVKHWLWSKLVCVPTKAKLPFSVIMKSRVEALQQNKTKDLKFSFKYDEWSVQQHYCSRPDDFTGLQSFHLLQMAKVSLPEIWRSLIIPGRLDKVNVSDRKTAVTICLAAGQVWLKNIFSNWCFRELLELLLFPFCKNRQELQIIVVLIDNRCLSISVFSFAPHKAHNTKPKFWNI